MQKTKEEEFRLNKENSGCYVLVLKMTQPCRIKAGKLPEREFPPGIYFYVGRAKRHLRGRLLRHLRIEKKLFWHVDYLLRYAQIKEFWCRLGFFDECHIASKILTTCGKDCSSILGFGASDCHCRSHLIYYEGEEILLSRLLKIITLEKVRIDDNKNYSL
jgi:Uri superfamily endonuclease